VKVILYGKVGILREESKALQRFDGSQLASGDEEFSPPTSLSTSRLVSTLDENRL
jgi:hypothetical protein